MMGGEMDVNSMKKAVAEYAVHQFVRSGMTLGVGTGSTMAYAIDCLGRKLLEGSLENISGVPTSETTLKRMVEWKIPVKTLDAHVALDVVMDGADQIDSQFNVIKGRGMALLREKMVAQCARHFVIIIDQSKLLPLGHGLTGPLPIEIVKFGAQCTVQKILQLPSVRQLEPRSVLRMSADGSCLEETDNGNYLLDLFFNYPIPDPSVLSQDIISTTGVVDHGLFLNMNPTVVVASPQGSIRVLSADSSQNNVPQH